MRSASHLALNDIALRCVHIVTSKINQSKLNHFKPRIERSSVTFTCDIESYK